MIPMFLSASSRLSIVLGLAIGFASSSQAYTPDDPLVVNMVDRGMRFLEKEAARSDGETVIVAYAHFKVDHDESNPVVVRGISAAKGFAAKIGGGQQFKSNYECACAVLLLCEISPKRYLSELAIFQRYFNEVQQDHGGFSYPDERNGDTSQVQYAILALWTLDRNGFKVDYGRTIKAMQWLMQVQDVKGPWPYHGKLSTRGGLTTQAETGISMALAGGASLLIAGDSIGMWGESVVDSDTGIVGLPKAIKIYKEDTNASRRKKVKFPKEPLFRSIEFMERWRNGASQNPDTKHIWYFYIAYTMERYESFREIAQGKKSDPSPAWYNTIVDELKATQSGESGGWELRSSKTSPPVSTAFAILFLIRSTQKSLGSGASASTRGGIGFTGDVSNATLVNGKSFVKSPAQSVTGMLDLLEGEGADDLDGKAMADNAKLPTDPVARNAQLDRLERLVRGSRSWQARRVAAKLLGTSDELRVVPALIFALSDPDETVRRYARDGLRFVSRKFDGFGMPDEPDNSELRQAQSKWRKWYQRADPSFVFLDD